MFSENVDVFVKIFIFVTTPLKVSKYFLDTKRYNHIGSNSVERINGWFSAKDIRFIEKMVQLSTLHIWINSHIFQNITIFMK